MATLDQLEKAFLKAHQSGNKEHAKIFADEIRKMRAAQEKPATPETPVEVEKPGAIRKFAGMAGRSTLGAAEAATSAITGMGAQIAGGLRGVGAMLAGGTAEEAAEKIRETEQKYTYAPRTKEGQKLGELAAMPMEAATAVGGKVGGAIGEVLGGTEGRLMGESIGEAAPQMALAASPLLKIGGRAMAGVPSRAEQVPVAGETYSPLRQLPPEQAARMERQKSQGIEPTLGSVTREPQQYRWEEQTAKMTDTEAGKALYERETQNQQAIMQAIRDVDTKLTQEKGLKPTTESKLETGANLQGAIQAKERASWKEVGRMYDEARDAGETKLVIPTKALDDWLNKHRSEAISVPEIQSMQNKVEQMKAQYGGNLTLGDMEELYKTAGSLAKPDTPSAKWMGDIKNVINQDTAGKGGDLYRAARKARLNYAKEFENQKSVADLIGTRAGFRGDPKVATEDVFNKAVLNKSTSVQDLQNIGRTLMSGDLKALPQGPQAMRNLQSYTVTHLLENANVGTMDAPRLSAAKFRREVKTIGRDKLNYLLGKKSVDKLYDTIRTLEETQVQPGKVTGSPTALNLKMESGLKEVGKTMMDHMLSGKFGLAYYAAKGGIKKAGEVGGRERELAALKGRAEEAMYPRRASLAEIRETAAKERAQRRKYRMEEAEVVPTAVAATAMGEKETEQRRKEKKEKQRREREER